MQSQSTPPTTGIVTLKDDFYRDGFKTIILSICMTLGAITLLIVVSLYFFLHQVLPVTFPVYDDWRVIKPDAPLDQPYLKTPDLLQWISTTVPKVFTSDFIHYNDRLQSFAHYFTTSGWPKYVDVVNSYMSYDNFQKDKTFMSATAAGAPVILNQGILEGKYSWWVQMPIDVLYSGLVKGFPTRFNVQVLVTRVSTLNNLDGIGIENIIVTRGTV